MTQLLQRRNFPINMLLYSITVLSAVGISAPMFASRIYAIFQAPPFLSNVPPTTKIESQHEAGTGYAALPLSFELNEGQTNKRVKFLARGTGSLLFLTTNEAVIVLENPAAHRKGKENRAARNADDKELDDSRPKPPRSIVRLKLEGANSASPVEGLDPLATTSNYFSGPDPEQWRTNIPNYHRIRYAEVYPGIDVVYYGNQRQLEYDFIVSPGSDPELIRMSFKGVQGFDITHTGDLLLHTAQGDIRQNKPVAYQESHGIKEEVCVSYVSKGAGSLVGFQLGTYDPTRPLIIDPVLIYSTYLGGSGFDQGYAIAVDSLGNAYVTGTTAAIDFPTTAGAFQTNYGGGDAFVAKLNPSGTELVYATYLNGGSGNGIAVDSSGNAFVTGEAGTLNFPTTPDAFQTSPMGYDTFVAKLNPSGSGLVYSARFGGNLDDFGRGIALDGAGNAYITGWTVCRSEICTFPTVNAFQPNYAGGTNDAFVTKIDSSGATLVYSTYLGGGTIINATEDWGEGIAVDSSGSAYVTGYTYSPDFPITAGAFDTSRAGLDAFITKFNPDGKSLVYSTFLGGAGREQANGIAVDTSGNAYVTGLTESFDSAFTSANEGFPTTPGAFQVQGSFDAFVTKLNPEGSSLVYSTYLGGNAGTDRGWAIAIDSGGNALITGDTNSTNFPTTNAIQATYGGGLTDAFVTKLNASGSALTYSTFLGGTLTDEGRGIALNSNGDAYATGDTSSSDFPTANAVQMDNGGGLNNHDDAFVAKIGEVGIIPAPTATPTPTPTPTTAPALSSLTLNPTTVNEETSLVGTVVLNETAPSQGAIVSLASSDATLAVVPSSVTVTAGTTSASFIATTNRVTTTTSVTISGFSGGMTKTALLTINAVDTITIQRAEYQRSKKVLRVEANGTEPTAVLRVYVTSTGALIGTLTSSGDGRFSAVLSWQTNPKNITVRSSLGGSQAKAVTVK